MNLIKGKSIKQFLLMPAKEGTCPECATAHEPEQPHNQQSLFYQYKFYNDNGRWPTWNDALEHCSRDIKELWTKELSKHGVKI